MIKSKNFKTFEEKIDVSFNNKDLLKQAFTHRSYINENPSWLFDHNERLEFLGDAVLELVITEYLYRQYPDKNEGDMTSYRAALVNANMLSEVANELSISDYLLLSRGEAKDTGKARQYILANTFEALVGAMYLDQGYDNVFSFLKRNLFPKLKEIIKKKLWIDAKSLFQERAQEFEAVTPGYKIINEWGPDHDKHFIIGVYLKEEMIAEGEGSSKQEAEQSAARNALKLKKWED
ncbi:MAG: ribonuclease III [Candidatus Terrybacteria bacterium]|nr:ribonuclease III [Candidatus Terrybacteria bacterium]